MVNGCALLRAINFLRLTSPSLHRVRLRTVRISVKIVIVCENIVVQMARTTWQYHSWSTSSTRFDLYNSFWKL